MIRHRIRQFRFAVLFVALAIPFSAAFAGGRDRREVVFVGHQRYHYHDGRFFRPGWFGFEAAIGIPPFGAVVTSIPLGYTTIVVGGEPYYCYNRVYYRHAPQGYVVVPAPVVVAQSVVTQPAVPQETQTGGDVIVINVPNANGSYAPVRLIKRYKGYEGPQGEYYPEHPTVEQLRVLYGK
jgi:hypothetical protein